MLQKVLTSLLLNSSVNFGAIWAHLNFTGNQRYKLRIHCTPGHSHDALLPSWQSLVYPKMTHDGKDWKMPKPDCQPSIWKQLYQLQEETAVEARTAKDRDTCQKKNFNTFCWFLSPLTGRRLVDTMMPLPGPPSMLVHCAGERESWQQQGMRLSTRV